MSTVTGRPGQRVLLWLNWLLIGFVGLMILISPRLESLAPPPAEDGYDRLLASLVQNDLLRIERFRGKRNQRLTDRVQFNRQKLAQLLAKDDTATVGCRDKSGWLQNIPVSPLDQAKTCLALLEKLKERTFLQVDMIDAASPVWERRGSTVIGVRPRTHTLPDLRVDVGAWSGTLFYRHREKWPFLQLVDATTQAPVYQFEGERRCSISLTSDLDNACSGSMPVSAGIFELNSRNDQPLSLQRLGDHLVVSVSNSLTDVALAIDGRQLEAPKIRDPRSDARGQHLLRPGQYLSISQVSGKTRVKRTWQLVETPGSISQDSRYGRLRNQELRGAAVTLELARPGGNVESNISFGLQQGLQSKLDELSSDLMKGQVTSFRSSALMMDGLTGQITALASFPTRAKHLAPTERRDSQRLRWLNQHSAFEPLPIGSVAKVPFATAITQQYPQLLAMQIPCDRNSFSSVLGVPLRGLEGQPLQLSNNCAKQSTNFDQFIALSSNRYALELMEQARRLSKSSGSQPSAGDWRESLYRFGCVIPFSKIGGEIDQGWQGAVPGCGEPLWRMPSGAPYGRNQLAMSRVYLRMNDIENDYIDYYQSGLGGNRSLWPLVTLAQSYARILSNDTIAPSLSGQQPRSSLDLRHDVWKAIALGMNGALYRDGATARMLAQPAGQAFVKSRGLYLLAKTGTPTVDRYASSGRVFSGDGSVVVFAAMRATGGGFPKSPESICSLKIVAINFQHRNAGAPPPALQLINSLITADPRVRSWLDTPCQN